MKYNPHLCIACQSELKTERSEHCRKCFDELILEKVLKDE